MGLKNRENNVQYVRAKNGKFYLGKDLDTGYDELEGVITSMSYKNEEYKGQPLRKLIVVLSDGDDNYQLGINVETSKYSSLVSFLKNVDVSRRLTLHPKMDVQTKDGEEVTRESILVSQDGKYAKSYFNKDNTHGLPKWDVVVVGKKKVTDKSAYLEFLEKFVLSELASKLSIPEKTAAPVTKEKNVLLDEEDELTPEFTSDTDLPWEK